MWGFFWMFWLMPVVIFAVASRRRRYGSPWSPRAFYRDAPWRPAGRRGEWDERGALAPSRDDEEHRTYVESLETRIAHLEERLDFTERLLAGRHEPTPPSV